MRACKVCGTGFETHKFTPHQVYCSVRCQRKARCARNRKKTQEYRPPCQTPGCKGKIPYRSKKYCIPCSWARPRVRAKEDRADQIKGERIRANDRKRGKTPERKAYTAKRLSEYYKRERAGDTPVAEKRRKQSREYMRKYRKKHRDEINRKAREKYANRRAKYVPKERSPQEETWIPFNVPEYLKQKTPA